MEQTLKNGNLIYDVGLHRGEDTDYYLKKGFKVVAFEAEPTLVTECKTRFKDEIAKGQLVIVEGAIAAPTPGKSGGTIKFFRNKDATIWGTVVDERASTYEDIGTSTEIIEVPIIDFADCLRQYGVPHYMKIDIEGMDTLCLKALMNFEQKPDYISIESDKVSFDKIEEEFGLLTKLGYVKFQAVNQVSVPGHKEPQNSREGRYLGYRFQQGSSGLFGSDLADKWETKEQILSTYRGIFKGYSLYGDKGKLWKTLPGKVIAKSVIILTGRRIPGWYDTHAKHGSAK